MEVSVVINSWTVSCVKRTFQWDLTAPLPWSLLHRLWLTTQLPSFPPKLFLKSKQIALPSKEHSSIWWWFICLCTNTVILPNHIYISNVCQQWSSQHQRLTTRLLTKQTIEQSTLSTVQWRLHPSLCALIPPPVLFFCQSSSKIT